MTALSDFRAKKDQFFAQDHHSPLTPDKKGRFRGLSYYQENPALVVTATLEPAADQTPVVMGTTDGASQTYVRAGIVRFLVDGQPAQVTLFASANSHDLFLPFRDATSGHETYGAGRYIEVQPPGPGGQVTIDFNYAYNPFCAYNEGYSCPLPPPENWLQVPIRAGEGVYPDH